MQRTTRYNLLASAIISIAFFGFVYWSVPLKDAFQFGADEGYELLKGFMCSNGFSLYKEIWNDQPPLHTMLLSTLFKVFGPTLFGARLLALGFGTLLFLSFYNIVAIRSGNIGAVAGVLFLLVSPHFWELCVSVMLEAPAFGTALLATWMLFLWRERQHKSWLLVSGLIMGCALQIKFTAGILLPAMMAEILLGVTAIAGRARLVPVLKFGGIWFAGFCLSFITIGIFSGESIQTMWRSHTSLGVHEVMGNPLDYRFSFMEFDQHFEALAGTVFGVLVILLRKQWRQMAFPLIFLLTALTVHLFHRPYWYYYYLHLLVPMAWISGHAVSNAFKRFPAQPVGGRFQHRLKTLWFASMGTCLILMWLVEGGPRLYSELNSLAGQPRVQNEKLLKKILEHREGTKWFYSDDCIYPFLARLRVPPELVVLPHKRFWSGQINEEQVLDYVKRYQPEQVLLTLSSKLSPAWKISARIEYDMVYEDGLNKLFVSKKLVSTVSSSTRTNN